MIFQKIKNSFFLNKKEFLGIFIIKLLFAVFKNFILTEYSKNCNEHFLKV